MSFRTDWVYDRVEATSNRGMVAAKHPLAAEAGADVLREGGNAVDAAVVAGFVAGVVEPFMSGVGGGGFLVAHFPARHETVVVDHAMVAPRAATPSMYSLSGGTDDSMFGWQAVVDDANISGHSAAAVPGTVDGLALALERFGTVSLERALSPAIRYAEEGFPISWHTTLMIAIDLPLLDRFPASRAIFTDDGYPPNPYPGLRKPLKQHALARTLRTIVAEGPRAFYEGAPSRAIADEMRIHGGLIDEDDLAAYRAKIIEPLRSTYRGRDIVTPQTASGGPTVLETLNLMEGADLAFLGHNSPEALHQIAESCRQALADRLAHLADPDFVPVPVDELVSKSYAAVRRECFASAPARDSITHGETTPNRGVPRMTTTHVSAIDGDGNAVSLTSTLLGSWGCGSPCPAPGSFSTTA